MSTNNPKTALEAIFPTSIDILGGVKVYPLTLAHYAVLEKVNSYLVNGDHAPDAIESLVTMYVCCHDAKQSLRNLDGLEDAAADWAQELPPAVVPAIMDAIKKQIDAMANVVPMLGDDKKKKVVETD